jgi:hypothetical protein
MTPAEKRKLSERYEEVKKVYSMRKAAYEAVKNNPEVSPLMKSIRKEKFEHVQTEFFKLERLLRR